MLASRSLLVPLQACKIASGVLPSKICLLDVAKMSSSPSNHLSAAHSFSQATSPQSMYPGMFGTAPRMDIIMGSSTFPVNSRSLMSMASVISSPPTCLNSSSSRSMATISSSDESAKSASDAAAPPAPPPIIEGAELEALKKKRWLYVAPSLGATASIGSLYAFSLFSGPLTRSMGVVLQSGGDWSLTQVMPAFSTILASFGIAAAICGKWSEKVGPRISIAAGSVFYGGGYLIGAFGAHIHSLPLLIGGYGIIAGIGVGLAYTPPLGALIRWFPDKRGMATGFALCGFGGGALLTTPFAEALLKHFRVAPEFVGTLDQVNVITQGGRRYIQDAAAAVSNSASEAATAVSGAVDGLREVVVANAAELTASGFSSLQEGVYLVGTGSVGVASTFATLGVAYFAIMLLSAYVIRSPPAGYEQTILSEKLKAEAANVKTAAPAANPVVNAAARAAEAAPATPPAPAAAAGATPPAKTGILGFLHSFNIPNSVGAVNPDMALRTPQFWAIWLQVVAMASGGFALAAVAKTMMAEIFGAALPMIVTSAFASTFVMAMSVANLGGRLMWATFSDYIGRKATFVGFSLVSIPLYLCMTGSASWVSAYPSVLPLAAFYVSAFLAFSLFAGTYSTAPALEADLMGSKYVAAIHGRVLTANSVAALVGPPLVGALRGSSELDAIRNLTEQVDAEKFLEKFGAPVTQLDDLVTAKSVTIKKLLEILPPETVDPTPLIYHAPLYTMIGFMAVSTLVVARIGPVSDKYKEKV